MPFVKRVALLAGILVLGLSQAWALDPLPTVYKGPGYITWMINEDARLWNMEKLLEGLRQKDKKELQKVMRAIGFEKIRVGRSLMLPEIEQPIRVETKWLGFERRKHSILTLPIRGKHLWAMVVFRQDSNDEFYWRPMQFFIFDTDPVDGIKVSFPDILGEQIYLMQVKHLVKDDAMGWRRVDSIFKFDEKRLRLGYQETEGFYRRGKFQGDPQRMAINLNFKGDQRITRQVEVSTWHYMPREEQDAYTNVEDKPYKVEKYEEKFSWNPQNFSFYFDRDELEKLVKHKSPYVRRDAARRLGEILRSTHPQLEQAMLKDKDAYVRAQAALALANIGDPAALPSVEKALTNYDEPDNVEEALEKARVALGAAKEAAAAAAPQAAPAREAGLEKAATEADKQLPAISPEGPKMSEKK